MVPRGPKLAGSRELRRVVKRLRMGRDHVEENNQKNKILMQFEHGIMGLKP